MVSKLFPYEDLRKNDRVIDSSLEHLIKALYPIIAALFGIVIDVKDEQLLNAPSPTDITLSGIVTDVKDEHPEKASLKINLQPLGILQFIISLFLARTKIRYGLPLLPK